VATDEYTFGESYLRIEVLYFDFLLLGLLAEIFNGKLVIKGREAQ
jgi:hypothetical protein